MTGGGDMAGHNITGAWGEQVAHDHLVAKGYAIHGRNWRSGHYEIDIIAIKGNRIIFVEVKTRSRHFTDPAEAVDRRKMMRLARAADSYIQAYDIPHHWQFDIITVIGVPGNCQIEHIPDAFIPPLTSTH
jgi:putative endonuclease